MYEPLISIIVPVYKVEKYIHRCIESVLHQTYTNWELILVDDGSPDSCGRICDEYAMSHDKIVVIHKINQGVGAARNTGLHRAEGEWIYFLDSDDFIKEDTLEKMITFSNEGFYDIVMAGHSILKSSGKFIPCSDSWNESDDTSTIQKKILLDELPNFSCGKLYKRILWENVYFPVDMLIEDMYINPTLFIEQNISVFIKKLFIIIVMKIQTVLCVVKNLLLICLISMVVFLLGKNMYV